MSMDDFERELAKRMEKYSAEANKAADGHDTARGKAEAYAKVMKKYGVKVDIRKMTAEFKRLMGE